MKGPFTPTYGVKGPFVRKTVPPTGRRGRAPLCGVEVGLGGGEAAQPTQRLCLELAYPLSRQPDPLSDLGQRVLPTIRRSEERRVGKESRTTGSVRE